MNDLFFWKIKCLNYEICGITLTMDDINEIKRLIIVMKETLENHRSGN